MENAKFRVVEFEESDVLTASDTPADTVTRAGHTHALLLNVTDITGEWVTGDAYTYRDNGVYEYTGTYKYNGSSCMPSSIGWWGANSMGNHNNTQITAGLHDEWIRGEDVNSTFFNGDFSSDLHRCDPFN